MCLNFVQCMHYCKVDGGRVIGDEHAAPESALMTAAVSPHLRFREGLASGTLLFQRCQQCASSVFPPRLACPACGSPELAAEQSAGTGVVYSVTAVSRGDGDAYSVCLIDLDEGFRMMSTVAGTAADQVRIGHRVVFKPELGDVPRAAFSIAVGA